MVMSMYALLEENENVTMSTIENSLGGNICRCTGYRPILAAFKSLASDADRTLIGTYPDIEDVATCKKDGKCKQECRSSCRKQEKVSFRLPYADGEWYKVYTITEIAELFQSYPDATYMLMCGNTAQATAEPPLCTTCCIPLAITLETMLKNGIPWRALQRWKIPSQFFT
ncbi:[2Fe-2S] binding domain [Popillia japonica]|uniref:[2Fe-2S] binding domain n=1 Tax=Popillia japonica TaxID=7064 RepID=A0AAW1LU06_POPJA